MRILISLVFLVCASLSSLYAQNSQDLDLMPLPAKVQMGSGQLVIDGAFSVGLAGAKDTRIDQAVNRFIARLSKDTAIPLAQKTASGNAKLVIEAAKADNNLLALGTDESYVLEVSASGAKISAPNDLGVLHGLETFLQLVKASSDGFAVPALRIEDAPRFAWRGLMMDVS